MKWTVDPPTKEGFYWSKRSPAHPAYVMEVMRTCSGFADREDGVPVEELGHMFYGPLEAPP